MGTLSQDEHTLLDLSQELLYVAKLRARRKVLGVSSAPLAAAEGADPDAAEDSVMETGEGLASSLGTDAAEAEAAAADVLQGGVAKVVLRAALSALPTSLAARKALLTAMAAVTFPGVKRLRQMVYDDLAENFQTVSRFVCSRHVMQHTVRQV